MSTTVTDGKGRSIEVRELVGSALSRLTRLAGSAWGDNEWTSQTLARASILSIDGRPVHTALSTMNDVDGLWDQVDDEAMLAAATWIIERRSKMAEEAKNSLAPQASETVSGS